MGRIVAAENLPVTDTKPPREDFPGYAHFYSGNVLFDSEFDSFIPNAFGADPDDWYAAVGQYTYTLPKYDPTSATGQRWLNGTEVDHFNRSQWVHFGGSPVLGSEGAEDSRWMVTTYDPYVGDSHVMWTGGAVPVPLLAQAPGLPAGYSCRVEPGDFVTWSVYAKTTSTSSSTGYVDLQFFTESGYSVSSGSTTGSAAMTTSYVLVETPTVTAPATSYFVRATYSHSASRTVYVDSAILAVE